MDSILKVIAEKRGNRSTKDLVSFAALVDRELGRTYVNTDCVDNYSDNYIRVRQNSRQFYQCNHNSCLFLTNKSSLIVRHIRRHLKMVDWLYFFSNDWLVLFTQQKPYLCPKDDCKNRFYQKCDLRSHLLRHFDDKPFKCQYQNCDKTYTSRKALSLHNKSHLSLGFVCTKCHNKFSTQWMLNKHFQQKHRQQVSETMTELKNKSKDMEPKEETQQKNCCENRFRPKTSSELRVDPKSCPVSRIKSGFKAKVESKPTTKPVTKLYTELSLSSMRDRIKERFVAESNSFLTTFGLEEVSKYLGKSADTDRFERALNQSLSEILIKIETEALNERKALNEKAEEANQRFVLSMEAIAGLIEIHEFDDTKSRFFRCFACPHYSETIDAIVGHTLKHVFEQFSRYLSNRLNSFDDWQVGHL